MGGFIPSQGQLLGGIGGDYSVVDPGANTRKTCVYLLVDDEVTGRVQEYGPFTRTAQPLSLSTPTHVKNGQVAIRWLSRPNEVYSVYQSTSLPTGPYFPIATNILATPP